MHRRRQAFWRIPSLRVRFRYATLFRYIVHCNTPTYKSWIPSYTTTKLNSKSRHVYNFTHDNRGFYAKSRHSMTARARYICRVYTRYSPAWLDYALVFVLGEWSSQDTAPYQRRLTTEHTARLTRNNRSLCFD